MREGVPFLSKSRFMAGLQCHKRLYFECFQRDLAHPVDPAQQALFDAGTGIGELARSLYAGGVLVDCDHFHHDNALVFGLTQRVPRPAPKPCRDA